MIDVFVIKKGEGLMFKCLHDGVRWKCGRCQRGNIGALMGYQCKVCKAKVVNIAKVRS